MKTANVGLNALLCSSRYLKGEKKKKNNKKLAQLLCHRSQILAYKNPNPTTILVNPNQLPLQLQSFSISSSPMAKTFSGSVLAKSAAFRVLGVFSLLLLIQKGNSFEFKVGGSNGWSVPKDPNAYGLNQWAEKNRFQIGDTLLFEYQSSSDSVLQVTNDDYTNCNTENPVVKYSDGHTVFKFNQSGPYYFISGVKDNCMKYEKLHVVVLADRSNTTTSSPPPPPPPSVTPAPAPSSEINPTPEPAADNNNPPRGSAASSVMNIVGSIGALLGSSLVFVL